MPQTSFVPDKTSQQLAKSTSNPAEAHFAHNVLHLDDAFCLPTLASLLHLLTANSCAGACVASAPKGPNRNHSSNQAIWRFSIATNSENASSFAELLAFTPHISPLLSSTSRGRCARRRSAACHTSPRRVPPPHRRPHPPTASLHMGRPSGLPACTGHRCQHGTPPRSGDAHNPAVCHRRGGTAQSEQGVQ